MNSKMYCNSWAQSMFNRTIQEFWIMCVDTVVSDTLSQSSVRKTTRVFL